VVANDVLVRVVTAVAVCVAYVVVVVYCSLLTLGAKSSGATDNSSSMDKRTFGEILTKEAALLASQCGEKTLVIP
jgi:hypothetical protein